MVMVQDGPWLNAPEKPLRISGEQSRCQVSYKFFMTSAYFIVPLIIQVQ